MKIITIIMVLFVSGLVTSGRASAKSSRRIKGARIHRSAPRLLRMRHGECARGCETCDPVSGCTKCRSKAFLYVGLNPERNRQTGSCVHRCPTGYLGVRSKEGNTCERCGQSNCNSCFHQGFCIECAEGYLQCEDGTCVKQCPSGMGPDTRKRKCVEKVDCEVSAWSSWTPCALRSQKKSCKHGRKRRTRSVLREPTENGKQCPKLKEAKRCKTPANKCPLINKLYLRQIRRRNKKNRKQRKGRKNRRHEINNNDAMPLPLSRNKHNKAT